MSAQLKQQIDEKLEHLSETHIAEVLDFVKFLESKERQSPPPPLQQASIDEALAQLRQIVKTPAKGRLGPLISIPPASSLTGKRPMNAEPIFLDTNIIVYAYSTENKNKRKVARSLVEAGNAVISVQSAK
jgi:hypothetical protein